MTGIVHSYLDIILKLTSHLGHEQVHVWYFAARKLQFRLRSGSHKKGYLTKRLKIEQQMFPGSILLLS